MASGASGGLLHFGGQQTADVYFRASSLLLGGAVIGGFRERFDRRDLLRGSLFAGGGWLAGFDKVLSPRAAEWQSTKTSPSGKMLGVVDFTGEARVPMEEAFGAELDGRLYTDLSKVSAENSIVPVEQFYIRTRASKLLDNTKPWAIQLGGMIEQPFGISVQELKKMSSPRGLHLMECAGNARNAHFGMISVASWTGAPLSDVFERAKAKLDAKRVLISGFDSYATQSASSVPGASWVFTAEELKQAGAFLATEMNGSPLTSDHGAPLRLVVPGWYGCTCIKWVNEINFVNDAAVATSQMQEYAARTMQNGVPQLAREYKPAMIEQAAMPIRIEKWVVAEKIRYRVVGIVWGGSVPVKKLQIRFNPEEEYVAVDDFQQTASVPWSFWTHSWTPQQPGTFMIRLRVTDLGVVARRLEAGYYMRTVEISEI
jgi:DMSO/TMAO reductase YedYZ molybdopterin-dependent catalytic subunit